MDLRAPDRSRKQGRVAQESPTLRKQRAQQRIQYTHQPESEYDDDYDASTDSDTASSCENSDVTEDDDDDDSLSLDRVKGDQERLRCLLAAFEDYSFVSNAFVIVYEHVGVRRPGLSP